MSMPQFFPSMQKIYDRLAVLAGKEILTETERIEERQLSATFWDMRQLNHFLQNGPCFYANGTMAESREGSLKSRLIKLAHYQTV